MLHPQTMKDVLVNSMIKLLTVVGARPQFIKAGITSKQIRKKFCEVLVHTGQHYDKNMSDIFFEEMKIPKPDYNLAVGSGTHAVQTANMMIKIEEVLLNEKPDGVILYGDTNSTVAASLSASKLNIPVFHIEAGTRTHIFDMPEEQNRIVTDHLSSICFAPTLLSQENLIREGLEKCSYFVGDVMYDALLYYSTLAEKKSHEEYISGLKPMFGLKKDISNGYYLATCHRPENTDKKYKLDNILEALNELEKPILFSVHPRIKDYLKAVYKKYDNIYFVEPLSYFETLHFLKNACFVITDSGGLHKEAYLIGTPCVSVLRNGWEETLDNNWNEFVSPDKSQILNSIRNRKIDKNSERAGFGDGNSCEKITDLIEKFYEREG